MITMNQFAL